MRTAIVIASKTGSLLEGCLGALKMTTTDIDSGDTGIVVVANGTKEERKEVEGLVRAFRGAVNPAAFVGCVMHAASDPPFYGNLVQAGVVFACAGPDPANRPAELVFLNDDTYAGNGWLEALRTDLQTVKDKRIRPGLLGCRGTNVAGPQNIFDPTELAMRQRYYKGKPLEVLKPVPIIFSWPRIITFAAMVETETYLEVGGFDLKLPAHNFSDFVLSHRLLKAGCHNFVSGSFVSHLGSRTFLRGESFEAAAKAYEDDMAAGGEYYARECHDHDAVAAEELRWAGLS